MKFQISYKLQIINRNFFFFSNLSGDNWMPTRHKVAPPTCLCYTTYHHPNSPCPYNDPWLSATMDTKGLFINALIVNLGKSFFFSSLYLIYGVFSFWSLTFFPLHFSLWVLWVSFNFIIAVIHLTETANMTKKSFVLLKYNFEDWVWIVSPRCNRIKAQKAEYNKFVKSGLKTKL